MVCKFTTAGVLELVECLVLNHIIKNGLLITEVEKQEYQ